MSIRLDKLLADSGLGTRSSVRDLIKSGKVRVNEVPAKDPGQKVDPDNDLIAVNGKNISYEEYEYFMLNKPAGVVTATEDKKQTTVLDLIKDKKSRKLFPVGRLDKDTVGLLLITNDGELSHKLLAPGHHVDKTYLVRTDKPIDEELVERFKEGVDIGDEKLTLPAKLRLTDQSEAEITIVEGRYHQIKRMFEAFGLEVVYLKRLSMGELRLDETLEEGSYRRLTDDEIKCLTNRQ